MPLRDAVHNQLQHTLEVPTDITTRRVNSRGQDLSDDMLNIMNQYLLPCILMNVEPSRDAVDDQFQHTLDVKTEITIQYLNSRGQELSNDMLNLMYQFLLYIKVFKLYYNKDNALKNNKL